MKLTEACCKWARADNRRDVENDIGGCTGRFFDLQWFEVWFEACGSLVGNDSRGSFLGFASFNCPDWSIRCDDE
jgi:hypothetical protein